MRHYTDGDRVRTLAALDLNGGNLSRTVRQTGVPIGTLSRWRDAAVAAVSTDVSTTPERKRKPRDWADLYGRAASLGARIINRNLHRYRTLDLKPSELRDVAVIAGIAVDKHLDYRDGRKAGMLVDQSQHLTVPPGTTLDDLKALRDGLK